LDETTSICRTTQLVIEIIIFLVLLNQLFDLVLKNHRINDDLFIIFVIQSEPSKSDIQIDLLLLLDKNYLDYLFTQILILAQKSIELIINIFPKMGSHHIQTDFIVCHLIIDHQLELVTYHFPVFLRFHINVFENPFHHFLLLLIFLKNRFIRIYAPLYLLVLANIYQFYEIVVFMRQFYHLYYFLDFQQFLDHQRHQILFIVYFLLIVLLKILLQSLNVVQQKRMLLNIMTHLITKHKLKSKTHMLKNRLIELLVRVP